ncbi:hypothetical protein JTE90_008434 [Oedothorax gibbosus]|uniref:RNA helicase n=1 Tax=Oedothorax gibbosus TaxID=931172 RepID=A0AAV6UUM6_9ARAC|nr:hypothetical protein JTE90_008434 [Oedothorax gibbosus]
MSGEKLKELGLKRWLIDQCIAMGITDPTPVQCNCIPKILEGKNCIGISQTGTGKTLAFALPMLQKLGEDAYGIFGLVLTPTRELAIQIAEQFQVIGQPMNIQVTTIIGGMNQVTQGGEISNQPHIVVATPGRLADMMDSSYDTFFKRIAFLVMDEADRLLGGQFTDQLDTILKALPKKRQNLIFSATLTKNLEVLQQIATTEPFIWSAEPEVSTVKELNQKYVLVPHAIVRNAHLVQVVDDFQTKHPESSMIIFTKNCAVCQTMSVALKSLGFENVSLNSRLKQKERLAAISQFKSNRTKVLVATDVASRGLDIPMVDLVINFSVPPVPTDYIHRVGRTARAGRGGLAITLLTPRDVPAIQAIEKEINCKLSEYPISEKKVLAITLQVEVAFREAAISLEDDDANEKKQIYQKKQSVLDGHSSKSHKKRKHNK